MCVCVCVCVNIYKKNFGGGGGVAATSTVVLNEKQTNNKVLFHFLCSQLLCLDEACHDSSYVCVSTGCQGLQGLDVAWHPSTWLE